MNILFVYERIIIPTFGGLERVTSLLAHEMSARGNRVCYLSIGPEVRDSDSDGRIPQHFLPIAEMTEGDFNARFEELVRTLRTDVVIFQGNSPEIVKALKAPLKEIKKLAVIHFQPFPLLGKERYIKSLTPDSDLRPKGRILKRLALVAPALYRKIYMRQKGALYSDMVRNVDRLVLLSSFFIPRIIENCESANEQNVKAINNPLTFQPERIDNDGVKENLVLFVSRMYNPQKNITGFIDVWSRFSKMHPEWKAIAIGDGEHLQLARSYSSKKCVRNLQFVGSVDNVEHYYAKAKIYCMTSTYEGWGMVLTEAMAHEVVPVAFDSFEAVHDIISDGEDGLLVKAFDVEAMAMTMSALASDERTRKKMAQRARNKVSRFKVDAIVDKWLALFSDL